MHLQAGDDDRGVLWTGTSARSALWYVLFAGSLLALFLVFTADHIQAAMHWLIINDDVRQQIWPLLRYGDDGLFPGDYVADYYLNAILSQGYSFIFRVTSVLVDPRLLSKVLPYVLLFFTLLAVLMAGWKLAGPAAGWLAAALVITGEVYLDRMTGGLPRSFGFPIIALLVLGLVYGRPYLIAMATIAGGAFYFVAGAIGGIVLLAFLFVIPATWRGVAQHWSLWKRLLLLGGAGLLCILLFIPNYLAGGEYGPVLSQDEAAAFPEAGEGGRYQQEDRPVVENAVVAVMDAGARTLGGRIPVNRALYDYGQSYKLVFQIALALCVLLGLAIMFKSDLAARRLLLLPLVALLGYYLAAAFPPYLYLPYRYLVYSMPVFLAVVLPASIFVLLRKVIRPGEMRIVLLLLPLGAVGLVLLFAGAPYKYRGYMQVEDSGVYDYVAALPKDSLIAGWPMDEVQNIPYLSKRSVFLTYETHQVFHRAYAEEMRARMNALINAYVTLDSETLEYLNRHHGVTHLIVDKRHFVGKPLYYFAPFVRSFPAVLPPDARRRLVAMAESAVYEDSNLVIFDLRNRGQTEYPSSSVRDRNGG